ncbi:hypothetical protein JXB01_01460 [Candidatus Micrarchaeota archaeon]|nr:hypothetical protein [Candidatus Micrarchaeota archaeon]
MAEITKQIKTGRYAVYKAESEEIPENTYLITSKESKDILYNPQIAGKKLQDRMQKMSEIFVDAVSRIALKDVKKKEIVEFVLLSGALYYELNHGFKKVHEFAVPQLFLGIKRQRVEGMEGQFRAVATYENFESLVDNATVIMGDTIASGATILRSIQILFDIAEEKNYKIKNLIVLTLAGSTKGARLLKEMEDKIKKRSPKTKFYLFAAEQFFHVMPDGTDLRFLREDTIIPDETKKYTLEKYGPVLGRDMKCAVFDWGTRCKNPLGHYKEFLHFVDKELKNLKMDEKGKKELERMKQEMEDDIVLLESHLSL